VNQLYSAAQVRELDRIAIEERGIPGIVLMKRAGEACVEALLARWPAPKKVCVLCGSGNNAGDGYIIAGLLQTRQVPAQVVMVGKAPVAESDAGAAYRFCQENGAGFVELDTALADAEVIVDALLGTGVNGPVRPNYADVIEQANTAGPPVLAVDLPSGLSADTGVAAGPAIHADMTVTFIGRKFGLFTADGPEQAGEVVFADLDVPADVFDEVQSTAEMLDYDALVARLQPRHRNAHKLSHGHVLVVGGDHGMPGAAALAAEAAIYSGAGMVTLATQPDNVTAIVSRRPEVMARGIESQSALAPLLARASVVVMGPGLGRSDWSEMMFEAVLATDLPLVLDADGLNLLARSPFSRSNWILTPHPGEATRLLTDPETETPAVQSDRLAALHALHTRYQGTLLLKGAGTLIADAAGTWLCPYGNPGMSVAGMGDLLSGTIGGLLAQGLGPREATCLGAVVHSLAADIVVARQGEIGLLATELLPEIRRLLNHL
jgi:NAD(P)H-hydrate epimerase